ncbi:MAG TPA: MTAP family purine nucleoside phosphorylase [Acidimicrobiales bacterium]|nr:MTAP family purine nucleoside phosphorylase [Acidimicrobiales bacterium]
MSVEAGAVGLISGSGTAAWPGLDGRAETVPTRWGDVEVTVGDLGGVAVAHISRHGAGHRRLSNHVAHRANIAALADLRVGCVVSQTVCGSLDPDAALGSLVVFDDLHFPSNRLPDGSLCTFHDQAGGAGRGHWIFDGPFSEQLRDLLVGGARAAGVPVVDGGCYGHVDGPRFNTRSEIAALRAVGVTAVSQTAAPEAVLAGEAGLPFALVGYLTDHANGVSSATEPVEALLARVAASTTAFATAIGAALPAIRDAELAPAGVRHTFEP